MQLGVIGAGNMGSAIVNGYLKSGATPSDIIVYDHSKKDVSDRFEGVKEGSSVKELVKMADVIILAVKPGAIDDLLDDIWPVYREEKLIVSIAAGVTIKKIQTKLGDTAKIVRAMPNTPAMINEGMSGICKNANVSESEFAGVFDIFRGIGVVQEVPEGLMDVVTGLSGSAPAFVYIFIEALADGAVLNGMPRDKAYTFAAQTVLGSASMVLETGKHPAILKDMVTSPGGTTIAGIKKLEEGGFRNSVMEAVTAATVKSAQSGK